MQARRDLSRVGTHPHDARIPGEHRLAFQLLQQRIRDAMDDSAMFLQNFVDFNKTNADAVVEPRQHRRIDPR